jgi:hypothetical protein
MIKHRCPNCDHILNSADGLGGTPIQCWKCHTRLVVPPKSEKGLEIPPELLAKAEARARESQAEPGFFSRCSRFFKGLVPGSKKTETPVPPPV